MISSDIHSHIFGLDLSDRAIRLIALKKKGKKIVVTSYNEIDVPEGVIINGEIQDADTLGTNIRKLIKTVKGHKINTKNVISVLPESKTFIKVITIPYGQQKKDAEKIEQLIREEIVNHIPMSPDEIYLDWQIIEQHADDAKVLVGAAPKTIIDSYFTTLEKSGLLPYVLEIEAVAITRCLIPEKTDGAKIVIDFGAVRTGIIVYDHQTIQFTISSPLSGNKITETIAKTLRLDRDQAEKAKVVCGLDPEKCEGALLKILMKTMDGLAVQIKKTIAFYGSNFPGGSPIAEVILCGGGANFLSIDKVLSEKISLPVRVARCLSDAQTIIWPGTTPQKALSYTTAIGLALRALHNKDIV